MKTKPEVGLFFCGCNFRKEKATEGRKKKKEDEEKEGKEGEMKMREKRMALIEVAATEAEKRWWFPTFARLSSS